MNVVSDMGPLHYLILIGAEHVLPCLFDRVLIPPAVLDELNHPNTPEPVRRWAAALPPWVEVKQPAQVEDIPSLGKKGLRGAGEKAAIALAREELVAAIIIDDNTGRREAKARGLRPIWMLQVLDEAAERGLVADLAAKLDHLERRTPFYVGDKARVAIEGMKQRDIQRTREREQKASPKPGDERKPGRGRGRSV